MAKEIIVSEAAVGILYQKGQEKLHLVNNGDGFKFVWTNDKGMVRSESAMRDQHYLVGLTHAKPIPPVHKDKYYPRRYARAMRCDHRWLFKIGDNGEEVIIYNKVIETPNRVIGIRNKNETSDMTRFVLNKNWLNQWMKYSEFYSAIKEAEENAILI